MKGKGVWKKALVLAVVAVALWLVYPGLYKESGAQTDLSMDEFEDIIGTYNIDDSILSYKNYVEQHSTAAYPDAAVEIAAGDFVRYEENGAAVQPQVYTDYEGMAGASVLTTESTLVEYEVNIEEEGFYNMSFVYYPVEGKNSEIERSIFIDGTLPFKEFSLVTFSRVWMSQVDTIFVNENGVSEKYWEKDNQGNDVKPKSVEVPEWQSRYVYDSDGYITTPLSVYFTKGTHTISVVSIKEPMLINKIVLDHAAETESYADVKAAWDAQGAKDSSGKVITIEAEYATKTSSQMLYPQQDQASAEVVPASAKELLNNTIGGNSWRLVGQWIEWDFAVSESGYYEIALHDKQNFSRGVAVSRRVTIDGVVPFEEMSNYEFNYGQNWRTDVLSDEAGNPYKFYLEAGAHTIRMEVVLGDFSEIVGLVEEAVQRLNDIYRRVIKVTGVAPDTYRDYQIEATLPELNAELVATRDILNLALEKLEVVAGKNSDKKTVLLTMRDQLDDIIEDNEYFVRVIGSYKINVRACGNWITQVISQPLALDSITVYSPDAEPEDRDASFFAGLAHELKRLYYSFVIDYNNIGSVSMDENAAALTLWVGSGRDQANVIKALIDETFTNKTGISVNVQLVDMNTLLKATLVGEGPDVAIQVANTNGIAGAVLNTGNDTPLFCACTALIRLRSSA